MLEINNDFLSISRTETNYGNPPVINLKYLVSFTYFKKSENREFDIIEFIMSNGHTFLWHFSSKNESVGVIYLAIIELMKKNEENIVF